MKSKAKPVRKKGAAVRVQHMIGPFVRIVEVYRVIRKCGHTTDYPIYTVKLKLNRATKTLCSGCQ